MSAFTGTSNQIHGKMMVSCFPAKFEFKIRSYSVIIVSKQANPCEFWWKWDIGPPVSRTIWNLVNLGPLPVILIFMEIPDYRYIV